MFFTRDNLQVVFGPTKNDCARSPSVFARFSNCWLIFFPKSEIPVEGASIDWISDIQKAVTSTLNTIAKTTSMKASRSCM